MYRSSISRIPAGSEGINRRQNSRSPVAGSRRKRLTTEPSPLATYNGKGEVPHATTNSPFFNPLIGRGGLPARSKIWSPELEESDAITDLPSGETTLPRTPSGKTGLTSPVSNTILYIRGERFALTPKITCFPTPKNTGYVMSSFIGGNRFVSPEPVGSKTSWPAEGRASPVARTHFLSGEMDQARPSPRRTAGAPWIPRM